MSIVKDCLYIMPSIQPARPLAAQPLRADKEKRRAVNILESVEGTANCRSGQERTHLFADLERGTTKRLWRNLEEARKVAGIVSARIHFTQPSTQLLLEILVVFRSKPDTQLRVSPCFHKDFWAGESASPPRVKDRSPNRRLVVRARNKQMIPKPPRRCQFPRGGFGS